RRLSFPREGGDPSGRRQLKERGTGEQLWQDIMWRCAQVVDENPSIGCCVRHLNSQGTTNTWGWATEKAVWASRSGSAHEPPKGPHASSWLPVATFLGFRQ
ncbi:hypothetical protein HPP92_007123, partial [Vanilla planifolia]